MNKFKIFHKTLILFLILTSQSISAQDDSIAIKKLKAFSKQFIEFSKGYPQEKVYLHFDNKSYYLGETIWFKAYAVRADRNSLSKISTVLYVELLNTEGYVVETKKLKLENGECHGDFNLSTTNYGGFYEVRAYTLYMQNFGENNYFSRVFPVFDSPKVPGVYKPEITERSTSQSIPNNRPDYSQKGSLQMNFYPEGGSLVEGINSTIAFKATESEGKNAFISGSVVNEKGDTLADINTEFQGMGIFEFTPGTGKYYAKVSSNSHDYKFELPKALTTGYVMSIKNADDANIDIFIKKSSKLLGETLGLSITSRGALYAFDAIDMKTDSIVAIKFAEKLLPSGVAQITLYNASGEIMSERLIFVNHLSQMKINVSQNKTSYQAFDKVNLNFILNDAANKPIETTFSLSVQDGATSFKNPYCDNILTDLLLSSELKGYIENPGFYFQSNDNSHRQALNLLLMTQGWSRYSWKQMAGVTPFVIKHTVEKELIIEGSVISSLFKKKLNNIDVSMILLTDSTSQQGKCKTDSVGNFNFGLQDFTGEGKLILQTKADNKLKDSRILLNRQYSPEPKIYTFPEINLDQYFKEVKNRSTEVNGSAIDSTDEYLQKSNNKLSMDKRNNLLREVVVTKESLPLKISLNYNVSKELDKILDTGKSAPPDIYDFLFRTNKFISITPMENGSYKATYKNKAVRFVRKDSKYFGTEVGDDMPDETTDGTDANRNTKGLMPLLDEIESIYIVEDYGSMFRILNDPNLDPTKTVIAVYTLKKNYQEVPGGIRNTTYSGYSYVREFYSPHYNRQQPPKDNDYQRTLYWNPDVKTDKSGIANVSFYINNPCNILNISAETVTENGILGTLNK